MLQSSYIEERISKIPSHRTEDVLTMRSDPRSTTVTPPAPRGTPDPFNDFVADQPPAVPNTARFEWLTRAPQRGSRARS
jgi:hypothetical protein